MPWEPKHLAIQGDVKYDFGPNGMDTGDEGELYHDTPTSRRLAVAAAKKRADRIVRPAARASGIEEPTDKAAKYRRVVFPGMKIPVRMKKRGDGKSRGSQGLTRPEKTASVPVMSVQCPLPGGTKTTEETDPVQKVTWGPVTRVEASQEVRNLVWDWFADPAEVKDKENNEKETYKKIDKNIKEEPELRSTTTGTKKHYHLHGFDEASNNGNEDETGANCTSQAEAEFSNVNTRLIRPPPPTPPDSIFRPSLSMPTLPTLHRISDVNLVEQYRLQRASDPEAFDKETKAIKQGLVNAKVARGGRNRLLKNEYTVELASREDAVIAERWAAGSIAEMRSRGNTLTSLPAPSLEDIRIRAGNNGEANTVHGESSKIPEAAASSSSYLTIPPGYHLPPSEEVKTTEPTDGKAATKKRSSAGEKREAVHKTRRQTRRELKALMNSTDLSAHVSKITTYGTVRHQHSEKREVGDHGEKRTVKTWIEITEVYEVPHNQDLKWDDVLTAVEEGDREVDSGAEIETDEEDDETDDRATRRRLKKDRANNKKKTGSGRKADDSSDESDADAMDEDESEDSDDLDDEAFYGTEGPDETGAEILLRSVSRFGKVDHDTLARMADDVRGIIATLRGDDQVPVQETEE
jgi:hypothetical protein